MNSQKTKKVLILGVTGMLGHALFFYFRNNSQYTVYGTARALEPLVSIVKSDFSDQLIDKVHAEHFDTLKKVIERIRPDYVVNCIGIIKQLPVSKNPLISIYMNSLLPHKIAELCGEIGSRLIHFSTDCVFNGRKGNYIESDLSTAEDLYGKTKYLGEVNYSHCVTLRTSIIGHELKGKLGLVEWFLSQINPVQGYVNALYSGFPTVEIARVLDEFIFQNDELHGLYHLSSEPISKYELLKLIARQYEKDIKIIPFFDIYINRSLDSSRFKNLTGYKSPTWPDLIKNMYHNFKNMPS